MSLASLLKNGEKEFKFEFALNENDVGEKKKKKKKNKKKNDAETGLDTHSFSLIYSHTHSFTHLLAGGIENEVKSDSGEVTKEALKASAVGDLMGKSEVKEVLSTAAIGAIITSKTEEKKGGSVQSSRQDQVLIHLLTRSYLFINFMH